MKGPFALTKDGVVGEITITAPGVYGLSRTGKGEFRVDYVGRSDSDVEDRLQDHVGKYKRFKYDYCNTVREAYESECLMYHAYDPPDNKRHPDSPKGKNWPCPMTRCEKNKS